MSSPSTGTTPKSKTEPAADTPATGDGGDTSRQRKFFPRLKALLSEEYEDFLRQVIEILETNQVAAYPMATNDTPWSEAFDTLYSTVATEYALPQGKNRLHKFKEKMVELWSAMQGEVTLGIKSEQHPIYRMAIKQWKNHQTVMKDKSKLPQPVQLAAAIAQTARANAANEAGMEGEGDQNDDRPRKKTRLTDARRGGPKAASPDSPSRTGPISSQQRIVAMPEELVEAWQNSLSRLESMLTASGLLQPKLPSPLYELHRLKTQMALTEFDAKVRTTYEKEIGRYLAHCSAQCRNASQPGYLPQILEGLEILRQTPQSAAIRKSIDFSHKSALTKYLKLVNRDNAAAVPKPSFPTVPPAVLGAPLPPVAAGVAAAPEEEDDEDAPEEEAAV